MPIEWAGRAILSALASMVGANSHNKNNNKEIPRAPIMTFAVQFFRNAINFY
jgi:hypothetical protein